MRSIFFDHMPLRHFIDVTDLSQQEMRDMLKRADQISSQYEANDVDGTNLLQHRNVALLNRMQSLRTTGSIDVATAFHGGNFHEFGISSQQTETGKERETPLQMLQNLQALQYRLVFARMKDHGTLKAMSAQATTASFVNALTSESHPLQSEADIFAIQAELAKRNGGKEVWRPRVVFAGRGDNNVTISQAEAAMMMGWEWTHTGPVDDFRIPSERWTGIQKLAYEYGGQATFEPDPERAVDGVDALYNDITLSMGEKSDALLAARVQEKLPPYQINANLMQRANPHAVYGHCLPAEIGTEVTEEVYSGPQSIVIEIARGRTITTAALIELLLQKN